MTNHSETANRMSALEILGQMTMTAASRPTLGMSALVKFDATLVIGVQEGMIGIMVEV